MQTQVEFTTDLFPELPGEAEESDNGFIGRGFAEWIRDKLPEHGQATDSDGIVAEDFGWLCYLENEFPLWIGCNNHGENADGGTSYTAMIVAEPPFRFFRKIDTKPALTKAVDALKSLIESEPGIRDVSWIDD